MIKLTFHRHIKKHVKLFHTLFLIGWKLGNFVIICKIFKEKKNKI